MGDGGGENSGTRANGVLLVWNYGMGQDCAPFCLQELLDSAREILLCLNVLASL